MPHNSHNTQNVGATVGMSNGVLSTNGNAGIAGTTTTASSSSPGDDLCSADEVKVFKDEGEQDEEISSQNLLEEKSSLIDLTESEVSDLFLNVDCMRCLHLASNVLDIRRTFSFKKIKIICRRRAGNHSRDRSKVQFLVRIAFQFSGWPFVWLCFIYFA